MNAKRVIAMGFVAMMLAGPLAKEGRGDFVLWDDEQLTVNTSHSLGTLYDQSWAQIIGDGSVSQLYAHDSSALDISGGSASYIYAYATSTVDMSDGSVYRLDAYATSVVDMSGGSVSNRICAYDSSTVALSGGSVYRLYTYASSAMDISGGSVNYRLYAYDTSTVDISGGSVSTLGAEDTSVVDIFGGSVSTLYAEDTSVVDIFGGTVDSLYANGDSVVTFYARDFRLGSGLSLDGDRLLGTGILSGEWFDSTRWAVSIDSNASGATILAVVPLPGDANGDGVVSADDYGSVQLNFGDTGVLGIPGDANGDGSVSADDYGSVQSHFGDTAGMESNIPVPEPATLSLLVIGGLALIRRRRK